MAAPPLASFTGKQAIVTGAGSGIGAALCRALVAAEAEVLCTDVDGVAADVLRAIRRNRAILVAPRKAYAGWLLARYAPGLMQKMSIRFVARQRAAQHPMEGQPR